MYSSIIWFIRFKARIFVNSCNVSYLKNIKKKPNFKKIVRIWKTQITNFMEKALELYRFNEMNYPTTEQGIEALVKPHAELKRPYLYPQNGYINSVPLDPWGQEYLYLYPGQKTQTYDIYSLGADGLEGGVGDNADIGNWLLEN